MRFKHFQGSGMELEEAVSAWFTEYEPDIQHMAQSVHGQTVVVSFVYEESFRGQELRISHEHGTENAVPPPPVSDLPDDAIAVASEGVLPPDRSLTR